MLVTFVISTYNRRDVTLHTIGRLLHCAHPTESEIIVVDNASTDGTADAITQRFPSVRLIALPMNRGPCAKNLGICGARGEFVFFLDDDSFPAPQSVRRMLDHFKADPKLGAAVFTITLPDGSRECSAYPDVFIGCGTGFRREALLQVGGLPEDFFMQAEEYDLSLRLLDAGWRVRTFDDLHVSHLKTPGARFNERVTRFDVRNNLTLIGRHFPDEWILPFAWDWAKRYYAIAASKGHRGAYFHGLAEGVSRLIYSKDRKPVAAATFETFAKIEETRERMAKAKRDLRLQRVLFIDLGKNMLPFYRAANAVGLSVVAIAEGNLCKTTRTYRRIPVVDDQAAKEMNFDAAIISNLSPVHAALRQKQWQQLTARPVINLFDANAK